MTPISPFGDWRLRAACRYEGDPSWWDDALDVPDDEPYESPTERKKRHKKAIEVCHRCPVIGECRVTTDFRKDSGIRFGKRVEDVRDLRRRPLGGSFLIVGIEEGAA